MKFTVVIPLYNKEHYIARTLETVLAQTFQDYEAIVVDDGSTDASYEAAQKVKSEKIRIVRQLNAGVAEARNTGIYLAKGEYIAFLDADDLWYPNYLETVSNLIERYPDSNIFVTAYRIVLANKNRLSTRLKPEEGCLESYWETFLLGSYDFVWTSITTIRRDALLKAGCFKPGEKIGQDLDMWARVARNNKRVAYSAKVCADYQREAEQNARARIKLAYAKAFIRDLEEELGNDLHTERERTAIQKKYDMKMTAYIFTAVLTGERKRARTEIRRWQGSGKRRFILRLALFTTSLMPTMVCKWVYDVRLRLF